MTDLRILCVVLVVLLIVSTSGCALLSPKIVPMECPALPRPPADLMQPPATTSYWPFYERLKRID